MPRRIRTGGSCPAPIHNNAINILQYQNPMLFPAVTLLSKRCKDGSLSAAPGDLQTGQVSSCVLSVDASNSEVLQEAMSKAVALPSCNHQPRSSKLHDRGRSWEVSGGLAFQPFFWKRLLKRRLNSGFGNIKGRGTALRPCRNLSKCSEVWVRAIPSNAEIKVTTIAPKTNHLSQIEWQGRVITNLNCVLSRKISKPERITIREHLTWSSRSGKDYINMMKHSRVPSSMV